MTNAVECVSYFSKYLHKINLTFETLDEKFLAHCLNLKVFVEMNSLHQLGTCLNISYSCFILKPSDYIDREWADGGVLNFRIEDKVLYTSCYMYIRVKDTDRAHQIEHRGMYLPSVRLYYPNEIDNGEEERRVITL